MRKYSIKQAAGAQKIETLGGDYALNDKTQMSVNAHAALLSQFAKAGGFFDHLVETCPMRLGDDGTHHEATTSRPLLQSCVARLSRHARQGIVTIYTATSEKDIITFNCDF